MPLRVTSDLACAAADTVTCNVGQSPLPLRITGGPPRPGRVGLRAPSGAPRHHAAGIRLEPHANERVAVGFHQTGCERALVPAFAACSGCDSPRARNLSSRHGTLATTLIAPPLQILGELFLAEFASCARRRAAFTGLLASGDGVHLPHQEGRPRMQIVVALHP